MKLSPLNKGIVIRPTDKLKQTSSGIDLAEEKRRVVDRPSSGIVVFAGPGCAIVKEGMHVYFDKYKTIEVVNPANNESLAALSEDDVLGMID